MAMSVEELKKVLVVRIHCEKGVQTCLDMIDLETSLKSKATTDKERDRCQERINAYKAYIEMYEESKK